MAGERRANVIAAMDLFQLKTNKVALSAELRPEVVKSMALVDREPSLGGVLSGVMDYTKRLTTTLPEAAWRGKMVDYDAVTVSGILAGANDAWSQNAQQIAAALAATNARIEQLNSETTKKEEIAAADAVRAEQLSSGRSKPTTAAEYYNRLVQIYKDSEVAGKGKPVSASATEVERAKQWVKDQTEFIKSIPVDMRPQIVQYGLQDNRWQGDFQ